MVERIYYGCELPSLSNEQLLDYYEELVKAISKRWDYEGRYILRDYTKYEIMKRMGAK
jgi:hypothetical protein